MPLVPPSSQSSALSQALRELDIILANAGVGIVFVKARTLMRCNQRWARSAFLSALSFPSLR